MRRMVRRRTLMLLPIAVVLAVGAGVALAIIPGQDGLIHGCYDRNGRLRVVVAPNQPRRAVQGGREGPGMEPARPNGASRPHGASGSDGRRRANRRTWP